MSLEDIREKKHSKGVYIVIGLLLVGMAGFGTSQFGLGGSTSRQTLLSAGDAEVSIREYDNRLRYIQQVNPNLEPNQAKAIAIASLKQRLALADYLNRHPFAASNEQINLAISNDQTFFENGKFSAEVFKTKVKQMAGTAKNYRRSVSKDLSTQDFQMSIAGTGIVSAAEVQPYLAMQSLSRDISVAKIPANRFTATADDKEISDYYTAHKDNFMTEEKYDIEYIDFDPKNIAKTVEVSDEEVAATIAPPRQASYYLFADEATAKTAFDSVASGTKMTELAKILGDKIEDSGDLGELSSVATADALIPQSAIDAIFALGNIGDVTAPITVDGSVYLFELNKKASAPSESAKAQAKLKLQLKKAEPQITELSKKLEVVFDKVTPSLESINKDTQLPIAKTGLITVSSKQGIFETPEIVAAVEKGDKVIGKLQEPIILGDRVVLYRFATIEKPQQKPLSEVKSDVEQLVIADKIKTQMQTAAKNLIEKTKKDGLTAAAELDGYPIQSYKNFTGKVEKDGMLDPIAAMLIAQQSPQLGKEKASELASPMGDSYVYVTDDVRLGNPDDEKNAEMKQQIAGALTMQVGKSELNDFLLSITQRAKIKDRSAELLQQQ
ncbi:MAG: SurA N-terminal domain-containing protein [Gammaproteobacteria bacterium]|nr:SurA N-terminal domain-containing protein [Gammaproteobacteria bacterium]